MYQRECIKFSPSPNFHIIFVFNLLFCLYVIICRHPNSLPPPLTKGVKLIVAPTFCARSFQIVTNCYQDASTQHKSSQINPKQTIPSSIITKAAMYDHISTYNGCDMIVAELSIVSKLVAVATTQ